LEQIFVILVGYETDKTIYKIDHSITELTLYYVNPALLRLEAHAACDDVFPVNRAMPFSKSHPPQRRSRSPVIFGDLPGRP